jgi:hypothetical protein
MDQSVTMPLNVVIKYIIFCRRSFLCLIPIMFLTKCKRLLFSIYYCTYVRYIRLYLAAQ